MNINPVGLHLEAECVGCGEPLLIGSGDAVHLKLDFDGDDAVPVGFLCRECDMKENEGRESLARIHRMVCSECGHEMNREDIFLPVEDRENQTTRLVCGKCMELDEWTH